MQVGDLVQFDSPISDYEPERYKSDYGIILKLSRTGHVTSSAEVLFNDGKVAWISTQTLVVINEGG
jgi:hypothetical protein|tara:strand:- start:1256 stop:1453 length:198 start_codon:yes stop_codon:yes gene_type:complete